MPRCNSHKIRTYTAPMVGPLQILTHNPPPGAQFLKNWVIDERVLARGRRAQVSRLEKTGKEKTWPLLCMFQRNPSRQAWKFVFPGGCFEKASTKRSLFY